MIECRVVDLPRRFLAGRYHTVDGQKRSLWVVE